MATRRPGAWRPWWRRPWVWLAAAAAAVFLGNAGFRRLVSRSLELRRLRRELAGLRSEEAELARRIEEAKRGAPALERAARRDLGYRKPGEVEYRFPPPTSRER